MTFALPWEQERALVDIRQRWCLDVLYVIRGAPECDIIVTRGTSSIKEVILRYCERRWAGRWRRDWPFVLNSVASQTIRRLAFANRHPLQFPRPGSLPTVWYNRTVERKQYNTSSSRSGFAATHNSIDVQNDGRLVILLHNLSIV